MIHGIGRDPNAFFHFHPSQDSCRCNKVEFPHSPTLPCGPLFLWSVYFQPRISRISRTCLFILAHPQAPDSEMIFDDSTPSRIA